MTEVSNFAGHLLIAMPSMMDPNFYQSVTLICEHSSQGSLGIVINQPTQLSLDEFFLHTQFEISDNRHMSAPVYSGGPVEIDHGFILHNPVGSWQYTMTIDEHTGLTTSRDILEAMAAGEGPEKFVVALGYAGWGAGQLEHEIAENAWLTVPADEQIIFDLPAPQRWHAAAKKLGIDLNLLAANPGGRA